MDVVLKHVKTDVILTSILQNTTRETNSEMVKVCRLLFSSLYESE